MPCDVQRCAACASVSSVSPRRVDCRAQVGPLELQVWRAPPGRPCTRISCPHERRVSASFGAPPSQVSSGCESFRRSRRELAAAPLTLTVLPVRVTRGGGSVISSPCAALRGLLYGTHPRLPLRMRSPAWPTGAPPPGVLSPPVLSVCSPLLVISGQSQTHRSPRSAESPQGPPLLPSVPAARPALTPAQPKADRKPLEGGCGASVALGSGWRLAGGGPGAGVMGSDSR